MTEGNYAIQLWLFITEDSELPNEKKQRVDRTILTINIIIKRSYPSLVDKSNLTC